MAVSLRKPAPAPEVAAPAAAPSPAQPEVMSIEAFVSGAADALEQALGTRPSEVRELIRRGPDGLRELSVYLPEPLARDFALHCERHGLEPSSLIVRAVAQYLSRTGDSLDKRELLELLQLARAVLGELARRARAFWSARRGVGSAPQPAVS